MGRLTGSSAELGHIKPGEYLFYLGGLAEYTLPWLPLVLLWCWQTLRQKQWSASRLFLLSWALGTLLLLSIASTKRTLYLFPLMPVFALMIGQLSVCWPRWLNGYGRGWTLFMFLFALALLMAPFICRCCRWKYPITCSGSSVRWVGGMYLRPYCLYLR